MCVFWVDFECVVCVSVCACLGLKGVCLQFDLFYLMQARW